MKKLIIILIFSIGCIYAQQDPQSSLYHHNPMNFNPAYAGSRGSLNFTGVFRYQWIGFEGAPITGYFSGNLPVKSKSIGLGFNVSNDKIGARNNTSAFISFAFGIRLNKADHRLAFGITGGFDYLQYNYQGLRVITPADQNYNETFNGFAPNFGGGIYYYGKRHFIGASIPRILESDISNGVSSAKLRRHYYLMGGYVFKLNSVINFRPSVLMKFVENAPFTFDVNANFLFYDKFWVGARYRYNESAGVNFAFVFKNTFTIAYGYDFPVNGLLLNQWGSHEIMLSVDIKTKRKAILSPRYF